MARGEEAMRQGGKRGKTEVEGKKRKDKAVKQRRGAGGKEGGREEGQRTLRR